MKNLFIYEAFELHIQIICEYVTLNPLRNLKTGRLAGTGRGFTPQTAANLTSYVCIECLMTPNMINRTNNIKIKQIIVSGLHYKLELNLSVYQKSIHLLYERTSEETLFCCFGFWNNIPSILN